MTRISRGCAMNGVREKRENGAKGSKEDNNKKGSGEHKENVILPLLASGSLHPSPPKYSSAAAAVV